MFTTTLKNTELKFVTSLDAFSPRAVDKGTLAMLSVIEFSKDDKVLDLGCGYGVVGILAAKLGVPDVYMTDINSKVLALAEKNTQLNGVPGVHISLSDGFEELKETGFTLIAINPPYHVDFAVPRRFIEKGFNRLCIGGRMYMVTKRKEWYKYKFINIFGGVKLWEIDGYFVFMGTKKSANYADKKPRHK